MSSTMPTIATRPSSSAVCLSLAARLIFMRTPSRLLTIIRHACLCAASVASATMLAWGLSQTAGASQVSGLDTPQSFIADPSGDFYFISNINGEPDAKDNNGFITKLDKAGNISSLHFIQGGVNGVILHAPKGMAIVDRVLYVVDLDTIRGFDKETGRTVSDVSLDSTRVSGQKQSAALIDIAYDGKGVLYLSDTGANTIYRMDLAAPGGIAVLTNEAVLAGPAGIAWNPKSGKLVAVSWNKGKIFEISSGGAIKELVSNSFFSSRFHNLSGIDFDEWGSMYVSDFSAGKVWRIRPDMRFEVIAEFLSTPADLGIDRKNHLILVPYHYGNAAEINGLERPSTGGNSKKRSLADYGFDGMKKGAGQ